MEQMNATIEALSDSLAAGWKAHAAARACSEAACASVCCLESCCKHRLSDNGCCAGITGVEATGEAAAMHVASGWARTTTQAAQPASTGTPTKTSASMQMTAPISEWAQMQDPNASQAAAI